MQKSVVFCLLIASNTAFAISSKLSDVINTGSQAIERVGVPKIDASDAPDKPDAHSISVTGTVTAPDGSVAENFTVKAFTGKLGGSQLAGSALTDGGGAYTIAFASNSATTIIVKVYCKAKLLATSTPAFNVTEGVSIDFTVPSPKCGPGIQLKQPPSLPMPKAGGH